MRNKIFNRDPEVKTKGISLIISLLFHAALIYLLLKVVPPVRFYLFQKVADVVIVSPDNIFFPPIGRYSAEPGNRGEPSREVSPETVSQNEGEASVSGERHQGKVYLPNLSLGLDRQEREEVSYPYEAVPEFHLDPAPKKKTGFSLGLSMEKSEKESTGMENAPKNLNLPRLVSTGLSSLRFNRVESKKSASQTRVTQTGQERLNQKTDFDISPWAKEVVDKIRDNWIIPPIEESRARGVVKILVVIGKDGTLLALEILESSDFLLFDESASQAIRSSAPFHPLPDDFPDDQVETYLVFEFNE